jgi:hypothetical protein
MRRPAIHIRYDANHLRDELVIDEPGHDRAIVDISEDEVLADFARVIGEELAKRDQRRLERKVKEAERAYLIAQQRRDALAEEWTAADAHYAAKCAELTQARAALRVATDG